MPDQDHSSKNDPDNPAPPARVLIVDDEPTLRMGFRLALVTEGFEVGVAANGEEALQRLDEESFDVMILDLRMPGIDGIGVLTRLAEQDHTVPTVIASAQTDSRVALTALRLGSVDFLNKPIRPTDLRSIVRRVIAEEQAFQQNSAPPVQQSRCLLRRRKTTEALDTLKNASDLPMAGALWTRVAETLSAPPAASQDPAPVSLYDLSHWDQHS